MSLLDVLGLKRPAASLATAKPAVRFQPLSQQTPASGGSARLGEGRPRSNATIAPLPDPVGQAYAGAGGKQLHVARDASGGIVYEAPPPKVGEITFSEAAARARPCPAP